MKLGLALSGGGFRASLFHIGVLARMAELDILGKVEVLSCVSGGSIVGAAYYLRLKNLMERNATPTQQDYVTLVQELERQFLAGVQSNVRMHLLTNVFANIRMVTSDTYSRTDRMASCLNRYFYRDIWREGRGRQVLQAIPLSEIKIEPVNYVHYQKNIQKYNEANPCKIPRLVINATTLNTGKHFRFTASEIGDPDLGYIRFDQVNELVRLKSELAKSQNRSSRELLERLTVCELNDLRNMASPITSQATPVVQAAIDKKLALIDGGRNRDALRRLVEPFRNGRDLSSDGKLFDLLYHLRVALQITDTCKEEMDELSLENAVATSAAVPGLFVPMSFRSLYDDSVVEVVRLVDGGVYDNQGLTALFEEDCTHIICSDASGQLVDEAEPSDKFSDVVGRTNDILMEKVRADGLSSLEEKHDTTEDLSTLMSSTHSSCATHRPPNCAVTDALGSRYGVERVAFFHLRSRFPSRGLPQPSKDIQEAISRIRTDLDSFTTKEARALMYNGYYMASQTLIPQYFGDAVPQSTKSQASPQDRWSFFRASSEKDSDLLEHLTVGSEQLFKVFRLWRTTPGKAAWVIAMALFGLAWTLIPNDTTLNQILMYPLDLTRKLLEHCGLSELAEHLKTVRIGSFSVLPMGDLFSIPFHVPFILLAGGIALEFYKRWVQLKRHLQKTSPWVWRHIIRPAIIARRWPLAPIVLFWALIVAGLAWLHLFVFDWLYREAGRDDLGPRLGRVALLTLSIMAMAAVVAYASERPCSGDPPDLHYGYQGWCAKERKAFYHTSQGTQVIPYDWFINLEATDSAGDNPRLFKDTLVERYLFIPDPTHPDTLPVGFTCSTIKRADNGTFPVCDRTKEITIREQEQWIGFTCAACHTGQINHKGQPIYLDGGPSMQDNLAFGRDLLGALAATVRDTERLWKFASRVRQRPLKPDDLTDVKAVMHLRDRLQKTLDLRTLSLRIAAAKRMDLSPTPYGFGRFDALGKAGNTVLTRLDPDNLRPADGPVSTPSLWYAWQYEWVQWTASIEHPEGRNVGQAFGVETNLFADPVALLDENKTGLRWESSLNLTAIQKLEQTVESLHPPTWPEKKFGAIHPELAKEGKDYYRKHCAYCHALGIREKKKRLHVRPIPVGEIGTDPTVAANFSSRMVNTGILKLGIQPVALALKVLTDEIIEHENDIRKDKGGTRVEHKAMVGTDGKLTYISLNDWKERVRAGKSEDGTKYIDLNDWKAIWCYPEDAIAMKTGEKLVIEIQQDKEGLKKSVKEGDGQIKKKFNCSPAYLARPHPGVWATPPFLHNGSVPTLHHLLGPLKDRPKTFCFGRLEFDPERVGFDTKNNCLDHETPFDTTLPGNSNAGHEVIIDPSEKDTNEYCKYIEDSHRAKQGKVSCLTSKERRAIIEYLKTCDFWLGGNMLAGGHTKNPWMERSEILYACPGATKGPAL